MNTIRCQCGAAYPEHYKECPACHRPTDRRPGLARIAQQSQKLGLYNGPPIADGYLLSVPSLKESLPQWPGQDDRGGCHRRG